MRYQQLADCARRVCKSNLLRSGEIKVWFDIHTVSWDQWLFVVMYASKRRWLAGGDRPGGIVRVVNVWGMRWLSAHRRNKQAFRAVTFTIGNCLLPLRAAAEIDLVAASRNNIRTERHRHYDLRRTPTLRLYLMADWNHHNFVACEDYVISKRHTKFIGSQFWFTWNPVGHAVIKMTTLTAGVATPRLLGYCDFEAIE
jgi:hypothetical protein